MSVQTQTTSQTANWRSETSLDLFSHSCITASMGWVTDTLNSNCGHAYTNEFSVAVEDPGVGKLRAIAQLAIGLMWGRKFCWKAFWDSNTEWSRLKLTLDKSRWNLAALRGNSTGRAPSLRVIFWNLPYNWGRARKNLWVFEKCQLGTILCVNMAALWVARTLSIPNFLL